MGKAKVNKDCTRVSRLDLQLGKPSPGKTRLSMSVNWLRADLDFEDADAILNQSRVEVTLRLVASKEKNTETQADLIDTDIQIESVVDVGKLTVARDDDATISTSFQFTYTDELAVDLLKMRFRRVEATMTRIGCAGAAAGDGEPLSEEVD